MKAQTKQQTLALIYTAYTELMATLSQAEHNPFMDDTEERDLSRLTTQVQEGLHQFVSLFLAPAVPRRDSTSRLDAAISSTVPAHR